MHTVTKISEDSETVFYIFFLIYNKVKNKQLPNSNCLHSVSHFNSLPQLLTKSHFAIVIFNNQIYRGQPLLSSLRVIL